MALNPEKIQFLINRIQNADYRTFSSSINQLFHYLDHQIKDNPIFEKYEKDRTNYEEWPGENHLILSKWDMPSDLEDAKSLAYDIYKSMGEQSDNGDKLSFHLYRQSHYTDNINCANNDFLGYLELALEDIINANPEIDIREPKKVEGRIAFIIHGHDNELKRELQLLLNNAGVNSIVLHEQPDKGRSIIDKLHDETQLAGYAIALLTPDDITEKGDKRARQNVILEIGYFLGKLGKERIRMIVKEDIEIPSDLQGILYQKFDESGAWKIKLLKEMQAVGIYVDIQNSIDKF
jgi:predicted nucleotide-binding protein